MDNLLIIGPQGSGKTSLIVKETSKYREPYILYLNRVPVRLPAVNSILLVVMDGVVINEENAPTLKNLVTSNPHLRFIVSAQSVSVDFTDARHFNVITTFLKQST